MSWPSRSVASSCAACDPGTLLARLVDMMLALSVWLAIRDAVASLSNYRHAAELDAPATPERVLAAVTAMLGKAGAA